MDNNKKWWVATREGFRPKIGRPNQKVPRSSSGTVEINYFETEDEALAYIASIDPIRTNHIGRRHGKNRLR